MGCKRKRKRKGCGLAGAVLIVSLVYYGIAILRQLHDRRHPSDYYSPVSLVAGQCGPGGCSVPQSSSSDAWQIPTTSGEPWIYKMGGREVGRVNADGSRTGFVGGEPPWYPSGMPVAYQKAAEKVSTTGQEKPTGVNVEELAKEKANATTGITVNGQPVTESTLREKLSDSARARGLRDYNDCFRVVIVGDAESRKQWHDVAAPFIRESSGKAILQEYDRDSWHVTAHVNGVKKLPEYRNGETFAFVMTDDAKDNVRAIALNPTELGHVLKDLRPEIAPSFDPSKARAIQNANQQWILWASVVGVAMIGAFGFLTGKPNA